eukprot:m.183639 g.183639  ORF g.183639 m.183639 type:complete len:211 (-) comp21530_c0_seq1:38-670(-)
MPRSRAAMVLGRNVLGHTANGLFRSMVASGFALVVAADEALGIGKAGSLPWRLKSDMAFFKQTTSTTESAEKHNAVVMGRKTWQSIPARFRPLAGRKNVVVTRTPEQLRKEVPAEVLVVDSFVAALEATTTDSAIETVFVIGGGEIYKEAMAHPNCARIYLTRVQGTFDCDTFLPAPSETHFTEAALGPEQEENGTKFQFKLLERRNVAE